MTAVKAIEAFLKEVPKANTSEVKAHLKELGHDVDMRAADIQAALKTDTTAVTAEPPKRKRRRKTTKAVKKTNGRRFTKKWPHGARKARMIEVLKEQPELGPSEALAEFKRRFRKEVSATTYHAALATIEEETLSPQQRAWRTRRAREKTISEQTFSGEELLAAKELSDALGGPEKALKALDILEQIS